MSEKREQLISEVYNLLDDSTNLCTLLLLSGDNVFYHKNGTPVSAYEVLCIHHNLSEIICQVLNYMHQIKNMEIKITPKCTD
jgi:hypothetical protein